MEPLNFNGPVATATGVWVDGRGHSDTFWGSQELQLERLCVCLCVFVCVCVCARARVRVRVCVCVCLLGGSGN
jgi:hypothetical protein